MDNEHMETEVRAREKKGFDLKKNWPVIAIPAAAVLMAVLVIAAFQAGRASSGGPGTADGGGGGQGQQAQVGVRPALGEDGRIGYATTGVVAGDAETLQDMVDEMYEKAKEPGVALEYKNVMVSDDGVNFSCYLGNSIDNAYDMFFTIYADAALTDELFLSELLRPGTRFEQVTFQRKLDPGQYTGYVVYTQVNDVNDPEKEVLIQTIKAQVATTIDIVVNG